MKKTTKIIAGIVAFVLIAGILWFANVFVGNPISKYLANRSAKVYIEDRYPEIELERERAAYDFKSGRYNVFIKSPTSIDTHFSIDISSTGEILWDSYEDYVLDKFNTWNRVNEDYRKMVGRVFESNEFPYESHIDYGNIKLKEKESSDLFGQSYGINLEELELDKVYNIKEIGKSVGHLVLYIEDEKIDAERASEILIDIKDTFDRENVPFYAIDFSLEEPRNEDNKPFHEMERFEVQDFLYTDIHDYRLIERLEKAAKDLEEYYEKVDSKEEELREYNKDKDAKKNN